MQSDPTLTTDRDRNAWGVALEKYVDEYGGCVPVSAADFGAVGLIAIASERERCATIAAEEEQKAVLPVAGLTAMRIRQAIEDVQAQNAD